jgi:hypothetical protein
MQTKTSKKTTQLTARDFTLVYEPGIGQSYQNGPYTILMGRESYAVTYKGQTIKWGLTDFLSAVEACAKHARDVERKLIPSAYTRRCQMIEEHGRLTSEE